MVYGPSSGTVSALFIKLSTVRVMNSVTDAELMVYGPSSGTVSGSGASTFSR